MKGIVEKMEERGIKLKERVEKKSLLEIVGFEDCCQRVCPECSKDCMAVLYGTPVFLGRKRKEYYKTVCENCKMEWYIDADTCDAFTKEELKQKYKTYFKDGL